MTFASLLKAKPVAVAVVGLSLMALGSLPAFADTPWHAAPPSHAMVRTQDRGVRCDVRTNGWDRWTDRACVVNTVPDNGHFQPDMHFRQQDQGR